MQQLVLRLQLLLRSKQQIQQQKQQQEHQKQQQQQQQQQSMLLREGISCITRYSICLVYKEASSPSITHNEGGERSTEMVISHIYKSQVYIQLKKAELSLSYRRRRIGVSALCKEVELAQNMEEKANAVRYNDVKISLLIDLFLLFSYLL